LRVRAINDRYSGSRLPFHQPHFMSIVSTADDVHRPDVRDDFALFGLGHGIISDAQYSYLVATVIGSAVIPTLLAHSLFMPTHLLPQEGLIETWRRWQTGPCKQGSQWAGTTLARLF